MPTKNYLKAVSTIETKQRLKNEREHLKASIRDGKNRMGPLLLQKRDTQNAVSSMQTAFNRSKDESDRRRLEGYQSDLAKIEADINKISAEVAQEEHKIKGIESDLSALTFNGTPDDVREHQRLIAEAEDECLKFQALINQHQEALSSASLLTNNTESLIHKRQALLADIAAGAQKQAELDKLNTEIDSAQARDNQTNAANEKTANIERETIRGLESKLSEAKNNLDKLHGLRPILHTYLLAAMAEKTAKTYKNAAVELLAALQELTAIDSMISKIGYQKSSGMLPADWWAIQLPNNASLNEEQGINADGGFFVKSTKGQLPVAQQVEAIKSSLLSDGILIS